MYERAFAFGMKVIRPRSQDPEFDIALGSFFVGLCGFEGGVETVGKPVYDVFVLVAAYTNVEGCE